MRDKQKEIWLQPEGKVEIKVTGRGSKQLKKRGMSQAKAAA